MSKDDSAALKQGKDGYHEEHGARYLARWFGAEVTEPVRLHVAAKRYLTAHDPDYYGKLSEASRLTLQLQRNEHARGDEEP